MPADQPVPVEYIQAHPCQRWRVHACGRRRGASKAAAGFIDTRQNLCHDLTRGPRSVGAALLSSRKTAPAKHQDLYMPRRRPSLVQPRRGGRKHSCTSLVQASLRASALRRRCPGCLSQHTKRQWCGSGISCVRMSIHLHPPIRKRANAASSSSQSTAGEFTSESRPKR